MADTKTLTVRVDSETESIIRELRINGETIKTVSDVVRAALHLAAREARRAALRAESQALLNDPADRAEMKALAAELDEIRAW